MEEILVDENGYKQFFEELEKLQKLFANNATGGSEAYKDAVGDGWHDNFAFEDAMRQSRTIAVRIDNMLADKNRLKMVKKVKFNKNIIDVGDIVKLKISYSDSDVEELIVKLTGKYLHNQDVEIQEVSLNSPIGKAIYKKGINDDVFYDSHNGKIKIEIIEIVKD